MADPTLLEWKEMQEAGHNLHYDALESFVDTTSAFLHKYHK
jgi:hypothetical protein